MDDIDRALEASEEWLQSCLAAHKRKTSEVLTQMGLNKTSEVCIDCDNEIPIKRREAQPGCTRCIMCQTDFEITRRSL